MIVRKLSIGIGENGGAKFRFLGGFPIFDAYTRLSVHSHDLSLSSRRIGREAAAEFDPGSLFPVAFQRSEGAPCAHCTRDARRWAADAARRVRRRKAEGVKGPDADRGNWAFGKVFPRCPPSRTRSRQRALAAVAPCLRRFPRLTPSRIEHNHRSRNDAHGGRGISPVVFVLRALVASLRSPFNQGETAERVRRRE